MIPGWQDEIDAAQELRGGEILGAEYRRVAYGPDHPHLDVRPQCRDCACEIGELHVPGCCVERCPRCGEQAIVWVPGGFPLK